MIHFKLMLLIAPELFHWKCITKWQFLKIIVDWMIVECLFSDVFLVFQMNDSERASLFYFEK